MSAILVLILRILLVSCIYLFLGLALVVLWREIRKTSKEQEMLAHPEITLIIEGESSRQFAQAEILIGRGESNDIHLQDETISMQHSRLYYLNDHWMIEDSQSTNGTYLNGEIIHSPTVVIDGDRIDIGSKMLTISIRTISGAA